MLESNVRRKNFLEVRIVKQRELECKRFRKFSPYPPCEKLRKLRRGHSLSVWPDDAAQVPEGHCKSQLCTEQNDTSGEGGGRRSRVRHAAMLDMVVNSCSPSTWEAEVKRSLVQSHPGLHSKPCLKTDMVVHTSNPRTCEAEARKL